MSRGRERASERERREEGRRQSVGRAEEMLDKCGQVRRELRSVCDDNETRRESKRSLNEIDMSLLSMLKQIWPFHRRAPHSQLSSLFKCESGQSGTHTHTRARIWVCDGEKSHIDHRSGWKGKPVVGPMTKEIISFRKFRETKTRLP